VESKVPLIEEIYMNNLSVFVFAILGVKQQPFNDLRSLKIYVY